MLLLFWNGSTGAPPPATATRYSIVGKPDTSYAGLQKSNTPYSILQKPDTFYKQNLALFDAVRANSLVVTAGSLVVRAHGYESFSIPQLSTKKGAAYAKQTKPQTRYT